VRRGSSYVKMTGLRSFPFTCVVIVGLAACTTHGGRSIDTAKTREIGSTWRYIELDRQIRDEDPCGTARPPSAITEIRVHRDGGCLGYYFASGRSGGQAGLSHGRLRRVHADTANQRFSRVPRP
jgi:hypothetical protein